MLHKEKSDWVLKNASVRLLTAATPLQSLPLCAALPYASQNGKKRREPEGETGTRARNANRVKQCSRRGKHEVPRGKRKAFALTSSGHFCGSNFGNLVPSHLD